MLSFSVWVISVSYTHLCLTALVGSIRGELACIDIGIDALRQSSLTGVVSIAGYVHGVPGIVRDDVDNTAYGIASV